MDQRWRERLTFTVAYARASIVFFLIFLAVDWLAFLALEKWLPWQALIPLAVLWPGAMFLVTWDGDEDFG